MAPPVGTHFAAKTRPQPTAASLHAARKVRGDAKLERLGALQRERLRFQLTQKNPTYAVMVAREELGLCVGTSAVVGCRQCHVRL